MIAHIGSRDPPESSPFVTVAGPMRREDPGEGDKGKPEAREEIAGPPRVVVKAMD